MTEQTISWLRELAAKGGKGTVNNIDARCLGRIADELELLRSASSDALAGWRYIRQYHGDLYGVGWDRVQNALECALTSHQPTSLK